MVCGVGINDMPRGWTRECKWNHMVYKKWTHMLERCYSEKFHEKYQTYKGCYVCERWLLLSNFVEDITKVDGYDEELFLNGKLELDKDIKSDNENKCYCLRECMLVDKNENVKQSNKNMNHSEETKQKISEARKGKCCGENHPNSIKIKQEDKQGNLIKIWNGSGEAERETGIARGNIITCCKWYACGESKDEWFKTHKGNPYKSAGGFIWKYIREE